MSLGLMPLESMPLGPMTLGPMSVVGGELDNECEYSRAWLGFFVECMVRNESGSRASECVMCQQTSTHKSRLIDLQSSNFNTISTFAARYEKCPFK